MKILIFYWWEEPRSRIQEAQVLTVLCQDWLYNPKDKELDPLFLFMYNTIGPDSRALVSFPMPKS